MHPSKEDDKPYLGSPGLEGPHLGPWVPWRQLGCAGVTSALLAGKDQAPEGPELSPPQT